MSIFDGEMKRKRSIERTGSKNVESSKVVEITRRHHHHHHHKQGDKGDETTITTERKIYEHTKQENEIKKWKSTFELVTKLLAKTADIEYNEPLSDKEMRLNLVDMAEKVCLKAQNSVEVREYKALKAKYEHQVRKTQRMQKRAERMLKEVEQNRIRLDQHLKKVKLGEMTEIDNKIDLSH